MPIIYNSIPGDKPLNEIVFAGSHDAAVTSGRSHIQTQHLNIRRQAEAGVRIFDLRITGAKIDMPAGQPKQVALKAYHGEFATSSAQKTRDLSRGPFAADLQNVNVTRMKMGISGVTGGFGMTLDRILDEAQQFVTNPAYTTEFLMLKFDKCDNWRFIANECIRVLGASLYTNGGNLNEKKLSEVAGTVIVLFTHEGIQELTNDGGGGVPAGIYEIRNLLKDPGGYLPNHAGLQYYGKGGTTLNPFKNKIKANEEKQRGLMQDGAALQLPQVMGMMYWTATGISESVKKRNNRLWEPSKQNKLKKLWAEGLDQYLQERVPGGGAGQVQGAGLAQAARQKVFMPNFVMVDFANDEKCTTIFSLNTISPQDLAALPG